MRAPFQVLVIPFRRRSGVVEYAVLRRADAGGWQFVAGGGEDGESPVEAAVRETREEVGFEAGAGLIALDSMATVPADSFAAAAAWGPQLFAVPEHAFAVDVGQADLVLSHEHTELRWETYAQARGLLQWDSNRNALWELDQRLRRSALPAAGQRPGRGAAATRRVGLIADTHMPQRWPDLPPRVRAILSGVDLILHAGDVGQLWVLDRLGECAPVVAVHGNDETEEAAAALPYEQAVAVAGVRVLLCHSHRPDPAAEAASRQADAWEPKLRRRAQQARRHGASVYVFGHTHVPMARRFDGVLLVNPGAIASANAVTRQTVQSVAVLEVGPGPQVRVRHHRVDGKPDASLPPVDWDAGFRRALAAVSQSIASAEVEAAYRRSRASAAAVEGPLQEAILRVARRCWSGALAQMDARSLLAEVDADAAIGPQGRARLRSLLGSADP